MLRKDAHKGREIIAQALEGTQMINIYRIENKKEDLFTVSIKIGINFQQLKKKKNIN